MASRMEKYYNRQSYDAKDRPPQRRSQKNKQLYQRFDTIWDDNQTSLPINETNELGATRLDRLFKNYNEYKHGRDTSEEVNHKVSEHDVDKLIDKYAQLNEELNILTNNNIHDSHSRNLVKDIFESPNKNEIENTKNKTIFFTEEEDQKNKIRRFNLRLKLITGILFIIISGIILFLIYTSIK